MQISNAGYVDEVWDGYTIAGDEQGNIYIVWSQGIQWQDYTMWMSHSTDNGFSWSAPEAIDVGLQYDNLKEPFPYLTVDESGCLHLAFQYYYYDGQYNYYLCYSQNSGAGWTNYEEIHSGDASNQMCFVLLTHNQIPHIVFSVKTTTRASKIWHAKRISANNWEETEIVYILGPVYQVDFAKGHNDYFHVVYECKIGDPGIRYNYYCRSTNLGQNWSPPTEIFPMHYFNPVVTADYEGVHVVATYPDHTTLKYRKSTDYGQSWSEEMQLLNGGHYLVYSADIANNQPGRHLIFADNIAVPGSQAPNIWYMVNDDSLFSNSNRATAFNGGRHLIRDPFCNILHLVYHSQERVHYSFSNDGGTNWAPYHIIEDSETQNKDYGWYPSVALIPGMLTMKPCVVYCSDLGKVKYRWLNEGTGQWQGFTILEAAEGHDPGPPSVVTYGDQVYVVFSVKRLEQSEQPWSAIYFYQFPYDATEAPDPDTLDAASNGCLGSSHVSITVDGNGDPHCVWEKKVSPNNWQDIFYRWREGINWHPIELVSNQLGHDIYHDESPHLDDYGNWLSVVWYDEDQGTPDEIWRRRKRIWRPRWQGAASYSLSPEIVSEFPVNAADNFTVWSEKPGIEFDIRYRSDTYGFGWVSQAPERESFCHSQLQRGYYPWDLYTIFTKGNEVPYQIVAEHQQFGDALPGSDSPLYTVETGEDSTSCFCVQRDAAITYSNYAVDYAGSELIYDLPLLDPMFPAHKIKGIAYFEGTGNKTHEIWINGVKRVALAIEPNRAYDFEILIPRELYQNEHRITVSIKNPQSNGVYLADLKVYRLIEQTGGGPQSYHNDKLESKNQLVLQPNPFKNRVEIRLQSISEINRRASLNIYDASGRLVKRYDQLIHQSTIIWDGNNEDGQKLPDGIYFLQLKLDHEVVTEKAILLR
jgi:hypothetical protein